MAGDIVIETERLTLRPWRESDAAALFALAKDPAVGPIAGWPPHESEEMSRQVIREVFSAPETYAVVEKRAGALVGCVGLLFGDAANLPIGADEAELGYWTGRPFWGRGFAPEAARALLDRAFGVLGLSAVWASHVDGNASSRRVMDKLGFAFDHTEHGVFFGELNETRDEHFLKITRNEWSCGGVRDSTLS